MTSWVCDFIDLRAVFCLLLYFSTNIAISPGVGKTMDTIDQAAGEVIESKWSHLGQNRDLDTVKKVEEFLDKVRFDIDSDKRAEGERRFVQGRYKREEALKRKEAAAAASNADS